MKQLFMTLVRYRGEYVALGRNQAMRMLLGEPAPALGPILRSMGFDIPAGAVVTGIRVSVDRGILRGTEAPDTMPQGAD